MRASFDDTTYNSVGHVYTIRAIDELSFGHPSTVCHAKELHIMNGIIEQKLCQHYAMCVC